MAQCNIFVASYIKQKRSIYKKNRKKKEKSIPTLTYFILTRAKTFLFKEQYDA